MRADGDTMTGGRLASVRWFLLIIAAIQVCYLQAQSAPNAQPAPSVREFFQALVEHYSPSSLPKYEDVLRVVDQIAGAHPEDISNALPAIFTALAHPDDNVKIDAAFALTAIGRRPDSAKLLRNYIGAISDLFNLSDPRLQATPTLIFPGLRPAPPPEVLPLLVTFLKRTDRDPKTQAAAIFALVRIAPEKPEVAAAIQEFLSRPLDSSSRIDVLNALGNPRMRDVGIIRMVINSIDDPDQGVRFTAIQALTRMGQHALLQAEPALRQVAEDPKQPAEVKAAATEALQKIRGRSN